MDKRVKVLTGIRLPKEALGLADGATLTLVEEVTVGNKSVFFGGHAEDMLVDMGMEAVDSAPTPRLKAKQV